MRRRPPPTLPESPTLADRLVSAAFGVFVGAGFGFVLALLLWGMSHYVSVGEFEPSFVAWMAWTGLAFGLLGLVLGSRAAELLGGAISAVWTAEAYAYWWYWGWRTIGLVLLIGVAVSMVKQLFQ